VESLEEFKRKEETKCNQEKNWSHTNFTQSNLKEAAQYTPMW
jgi:hypothetical protein